MSSVSKLYEEFQREFCPPLDSSLILAFLGEITTDATGLSVTPSKGQLYELRQTLKELAAQAEETTATQDYIDYTDDSGSTPECYYGQTAASTSFDSESTNSSLRSFSTPLGFLQTALPHIPTARLEDALQKARNGGNSDDVDIWVVVSSVLTQEAILEMEERGLEGVDDDLQPRTAKNSQAQKQKKTSKGTKITLVDIRQQNHKVPTRSGPLAPDLWTQVSSLSAHLSELLPRNPSFFSSYFHDAAYPNSYHAVCAALTAICNGNSIPPNAATEHVAVHITLLDILLPTFDDLDSELRARRLSDIELCVRASEGQGENALDLAKLLRDLDPDDPSNSSNIGIFHQMPASPTYTDAPSPISPISPLGPPNPRPPAQRHKIKPPSALDGGPMKNDSGAWQTVPIRKREHEPHPHAEYIPAYNQFNGRVNVKGSGNERGKGGKGDVGDLMSHRYAVSESLRKRDEFLREASKMWKKGNTKVRGGQIAAYYAERAREFQELAKQQSLNAARVMVQDKRMVSKDKMTVDLHGTTAAEAIVIVKEILEKEGVSSGKPLKVITGRGKHSIGQISVLKPAVRSALLDGGWDVVAWEAGLVIRERSN